MEKRAFDFHTVDVSIVDPPVDHSPTNLIAHPRLVTFPTADPVGPPPRKKQRRRKRLLHFILLESSALALLILSLIAGTSEWFAQPEFTRLFLIVVISMATAVAVIPVLFYGLPRQRYRYYRRRNR
jgi:hypothetical protein